MSSNDHNPLAGFDVGASGRNSGNTTTAPAAPAPAPAPANDDDDAVLLGSTNNNADATSTSSPPPERAETADPSSFEQQQPTAAGGGDEDDMAALLADAIDSNDTTNNVVEQQQLVSEQHGAEDAAAGGEQQQHQKKKPEQVLAFPPGTTLADLFGSNFIPREPESGIPADPMEADIQRVVAETTGIQDWASLMFLSMQPEDEQQQQQQEDQNINIDPNLLPFEHLGSDASHRQLEAHILEQEGLAAVDDVVGLFGENAAKIILEASGRQRAATQQAAVQLVSLPRPPREKLTAPPGGSAAVEADAAAAKKAGRGESWLLHLPTIFPNRRSLHIDRNKYQPGLSQVKKPSTDRLIYTPLNVVRYAHDEDRNVSLSNARLVRWSDGSATLHIGTDVYAIAKDTTTSLAVVGREIENPAPEFSPQAVADTAASRSLFVETLPYKKRVQLLPVAGEQGHSVENFLVAENRLRSTKQVAQTVSLATNQVIVAKPPVPGMAREERAKRIEGPEDIAGYIVEQDKVREQKLTEEAKSRGHRGGPTLFDRLVYDADVLNNVSKAQSDGADFSQLLKEAQEQAAAATAASMAHQQFGQQAGGGAGAVDEHGRKKSRLDKRDLTFADAMASDVESNADRAASNQQPRGDDEYQFGGSQKQAGSRRQREDAGVEGDDISASPRNTREAVLAKLRALKRSALVTDEILQEIDYLFTYFAQTPDMSPENMDREVTKLETKLFLAI